MLKPGLPVHGGVEMLSISVNLGVPNPVGAVCNRTISVNLGVFQI